MIGTAHSHKEKAMNRTPLIVISAACVALSSAPAIGAENWPSKPLRVIVPYGAGSTTDIIPRAVFEQLSPQLGQSIIVDNRAGAGGTIGSSLVARATPDGYTVLCNSSAHTIAPSLYTSLSYHPARDFAAVVPLGLSPAVLVVTPSRGYRTVKELLAAGRAKPGGLNFSSVGNGSGTHLSAEKFRFSARLEATHIPFKGGAEAMTEVIAGRADFFFGPVGLVLPHVKDGRLTALAVNSAKRSSVLPEVPTTSEAGYPNTEYPLWFGLFMPANTPREIVQKLNRETLKALQTPRLREKLVALGVEPMVMTPDEFDAHVRRGIESDAGLVKAIGLKGE